MAADQDILSYGMGMFLVEPTILLRTAQYTPLFLWIKICHAKLVNIAGEEEEDRALRFPKYRPPGDFPGNFLPEQI